MSRFRIDPDSYYEDWTDILNDTEKNPGQYVIYRKYRYIVDIYPDRDDLPPGFQFRTVWKTTTLASGITAYLFEYEKDAIEKHQFKGDNVFNSYYHVIKEERRKKYEEWHLNLPMKRRIKVADPYTFDEVKFCSKHLTVEKRKFGNSQKMFVEMRKGDKILMGELKGAAEWYLGWLQKHLKELIGQGSMMENVPMDSLKLEDVVKQQRLAELMKKTEKYHNATTGIWTIKPGKLARLLSDLAEFGYLNAETPNLSNDQKRTIAKNTFGVDLKRTLFNPAKGHLLS